MSIRLETSQRRGITNFQDREISAYELNWSRTLTSKFPMVIPRTQPSPFYNCHGLTFASRRTKIVSTSEIYKILTDDAYEEIQLSDVKGGDVVIYVSEDGDVNHSGIVVMYQEHDARLLQPMVCSKWGGGGEYIHGLKDCPQIYGPITKFYRCKL